MTNKKILKSEEEAKRIWLKAGFPYPSFEMVLLAMTGLEYCGVEPTRSASGMGDDEVKSLIIKTLDMASREIDKLRGVNKRLQDEITLLRQTDLPLWGGEEAAQDYSGDNIEFKTEQGARSYTVR